MGKKRNHSLLQTKREALRLLGARPDGTFGNPMLQPNSSNPHNATTVAKLLSISRTALYNWKQNAYNIMNADISSQRSKKKRVARQGTVPLLEQAVNTYIRDRITYMEGESLFRMDIICRIALNIRDELVQKLEQSSDNHTLPTDKQLNNLKQFKASSHWFQNFMARNRFMSYKPRGQGPAANIELVFKSRTDLKRQLCSNDLQDITNTDEVGVLFRSLPSRTVGTADKPTAYKRAKERFTAVLTVYADGQKAPLVAIGKSRQPRSFPKSFDPKADLGVYYYAQPQAWNTQNLWKKQLSVLDRTSRGEGRKIIHLIDNCSAHSVDNHAYENIEAVYFPPNLTSVLQPIDAGVGRSFKAAFRRLLVAHVLSFINIDMKKPEPERKKFKMTEAVTAYDALKMMSTAWDMVPRKMVLKSWLACDILAPYQRLMLIDSLEKQSSICDKAKLPFRGTRFDNDMILYHQRSAVAKQNGDLFLKNENHRDAQIQELSSFSQSDTANDWLEMAREELKQELCHLQKLNVLEDLSVDDLEELETMEYKQSICAPMNSKTAFEDTVKCVLNLSDAVDVDEEPEEEVELEAVVHEKPSLEHLLKEGKALCDSIESALIWQVKGINAERFLSIIKMLEVELASIGLHIAANRSQKQCTITEFFSKKD